MLQDVQVPVCPLCNQPVPVNRGEDPNNKVLNERVILYRNAITAPWPYSIGIRLTNISEMTVKVIKQRRLVISRIFYSHHSSLAHTRIFLCIHSWSLSILSSTLIVALTLAARRKRFVCAEFLLTLYLCLV